MAAAIPTKLKAADLTRFCVRAAQLEAAKPVVAYWCEYWIVNQILSKGLHNGDNETLQYTTELMDKLERVKADNATNDAIVDDTAGQAYVEVFASEVFERADRAVQADKVTKQTADTFQAAATFFDLINIWGPLDAETQAKIKYAKWNAVRIVKALKDGQDPNESNPKPPPQEEEALPPPSSNNLDADQISPLDKYMQASVQEVPDEESHIDRDLSRQFLVAPSTPPAETSRRGSFPTVVQDDNVSPVEPDQPNERDGSIGGGYFPDVPTFTSEARDSTLPTAPPDDVIDLGLPEQPNTDPGSQQTSNFGSNLPNELPSAPPSSTQSYPHIPRPQDQTPPPSLPQAPHPPPPISQQPPAPQVQRPGFAQPNPTRTEQLATDDASIAKAQKHAKWAISALNFEDPATAVKELRNALRTLGAEA